MYREKEAKEVVKLLLFGDSLLIVGASGIGKSAFAKNLERNKTKLFGKEAPKIMLLSLTSEEVPSSQFNEVYRLVLKKLVDLTNKILPSIKIIEENEIYEQESSLFLVEKIRALVKLLTDSEIRIIILIDSLDKFVNFYDAPLFSNLRSFRDINSNKFCYLFFSKNDMLTDQDLNKVEPLYKIISSSTIYLKPFNSTDTRNRIKELATLRKIHFSKSQIDVLEKASGGFPSFIKLGVQLLSKNLKLDLKQLCLEMLQDPLTIQRLKEIINGLSEKQREILNEVARGSFKGKPSEDDLKILERKGLVRGKSLFSELFRIFVLSKEEIKNGRREKSYLLPTRPGIFIDPKTSRVFVNQKEAANLTRQEFRLLTFLYQNGERICERDEVIRAVWDTDGTEGISEEAVDQLVTRLRGKIEKDKSNPEHVITVRGRGFTFKP